MLGAPRIAVAMKILVAVYLLVLAPAFGAASPPLTADGEAVLAGDAAWDRRAEGARNGKPAPGPIADAVAAYRSALEHEPNDLAIRLKLLRALFFQGEYAVSNRPEGKAIFEEGARIFDQGLLVLADRVGRSELTVRKMERLSQKELLALFAEEEHAGPLYFWGAVHWGLWGEYFGKLPAVRKGVAGKIRRLGEAATVLAPDYENGGGHRIIGRLHTLSPRVPLITGWIDRRVAVSRLEQAVEIAPSDPLNRVFLADALLQFRPDRRQEALDLLQGVLSQKPRPELQVEDAQAIEDAREVWDEAVAEG